MSWVVVAWEGVCVWTSHRSRRVPVQKTFRCEAMRGKTVVSTWCIAEDRRQLYFPRSAVCGVVKTKARRHSTTGDGRGNLTRDLLVSPCGSAAVVQALWNYRHDNRSFYFLLSLIARCTHLSNLRIAGGPL